MLEVNIINPFKSVKVVIPKPVKVPKIYIDCDTPDRVGYWKELASWARGDASRKWAFERLNMLMNRLIAVGPQNTQDFYVIQGAMAEIQNFIDMPELVEEKLKEAMTAVGLIKEKQEESISDDMK